MDCAMERISRMEKAFYPRNDTVNGVVSNLLPRDGKEDILEDQSGDPVFLQRSSILDGTIVKGFGYVNEKPYKWRLEIESAVKSVAVVPDRFFSIYGKSYPIKRRQTVGINQPSESFKYEIIYKRGYDQYDDQAPEAKIIYHKQMENNEVTNPCVSSSDDEALRYLNNVEGYPYLKIRVCWDNSVRAYLGSTDVDWDLMRQIEDTAAETDNEWIEIPQINTDQFKGIDLWVRFDSINALAYYILTKYEDDIFDIGPKAIESEIKTSFTRIKVDGENRLDFTIKQTTPPAGANYEFTYWESYNGNTWTQKVHDLADGQFLISLGSTDIYQGVYDIEDGNITLAYLKEAQGDKENILVYKVGGPTGVTYKKVDINEIISLNLPTSSFEGGTGYYDLIKIYTGGNDVAGVVGRNYNLNTPSELIPSSTNCVPCCKKDNLSRSIWAYVNPKTMTPYDDDYWFHQGEPFYKKSLTLSTKQNPLKAKKIFVEQGVFPGMYKIVGETYIRSRDTGEDERMQITLPLCKIMSNQTLTLQADGDPTTFNLEVQVATPQNGIPMELTFYETEQETKIGCSGNRIAKDGSTKISVK